MAKQKSHGTGRGGSFTESSDTKTSSNKTVTKKNSTSNKQPKSKQSKSESSHIDWISSLARENASNDDGMGAKVLSKEDRKRKRESKKNRRIEQKRQKQLQQQQQQRPRQTSIQEPFSENSLNKSHTSSSQQQTQSLLLLKLSKDRLRRLSQILRSMPSTKGHSRPYYDLPKRSNEKATLTSFGSNELNSSKKRKRRKWNEDTIQPLRSDYSGIGLARTSMYIEFLDPSYFPKLEEEFREHIPGFFGKQRTKAMKRQMDGNMLWRRLANEKKQNNNSKKFKGMSTDERVQAMIDSSDRADLMG